MIELGLVIAAGVAALIGLCAIPFAAFAPDESSHHRRLRVAQAGLALSGMLIVLSYFAYGAEYGLTGGLLLLLFGTGMTAVGRRRAKG
ncbi:hypothetical protein IP78_14740 [Brevundimonas sp. AAP58]|uniref:hypothetical protein n=1 Tax=Brevundimonas sp. AAP58 TaxID=1523422 RepID=UPI0006B9D70A|nr:hypothetical protein [Brevundimonas sp. AAP58]KPF73577.1 hypothetical protein IP78_14740 [Brevundimonas sp. AAP58]